MKPSITRRDFLNGAALALAAGATLSPRDLLAIEHAAVAPNPIGPDYYPPKLTGMRGSHDGSFEVSHALAWGGQKPSTYTTLDETYDLIIVGGGISGLTSAYLYRQQAGANKKILILDNHDDFGGHAKRNEFELDGRTFLGVGGSVNLEQMSFSDTVHRVLKEIGVDLEKLDAAREPDYMLSGLDAGYGLFLNGKQFGKDQVSHGKWPMAFLGSGDLEGLLGSLDLPAEEKKKLVGLADGERDLLDELSLSETLEYLDKTTYSDFLRTHAGLSENTIRLFEPMAQVYIGTGPDTISVMEGFLIGYPGMKSVGLTGSMVSKLYRYFLGSTHFPIFPDGNASVARMMVRRLLPEVAPGKTMEDVLDARFDYTKLDRSDSDLRLRLNSTVVNARNVDPAAFIKKEIGGAHGALVTAVSPIAFKQALGMVRRGGTVALNGLPPGDFPLSIFDTVLNGITVRGSIVGTRLDLQEALDFAAEGKVHATVTTDTLENINDIFARMHHGEIEGRIVIDFEGGAQ